MPVMKRSLLLATAVLSLVLVGACSSGASKTAAGGATAGGTATAPVIKNFSFIPNPIRVKAGTTVTWTNRDTTDHTVQANDGSFGSGHLAPGQTFSHTFTKAGTYAYHCAIHTYMTAEVIVT